jgi:putative hemolysin
MINLSLQIAIIIALTLLNGLLAMSETALVSSRKARLKQRAEAGDRKYRTALELADEPTRFLSTVQIGISLIGVLAGAFGGATLAEPLSGVLSRVPGLAPYSWAVAFGIVVAGITYLSLIIGELVPKRLALNDPEAVASRVAPLMRFLSTLASPGVWLLSASTEVVLRLLRARRSDDPSITEQEVEALLVEGESAGVFEEEERELVGRALRLDDRPVRELMTPRPRIVWLNTEDPPQEHRRQVVEHRHSYYPVARGDLDNLLGLASVKDAWAQMMAGEHVDLLEALRSPPLVSEGVPATAALEAFKSSGVPVALVIDERGNCEGLVTLTDILEALVGEVPDLHTPAEEPPIVQRADGSWLVDGLLAAEELKARLGLRELPNEAQGDYQTVGGLVIDQLGRIPVEGDRFEWGGFSLEVLDMDGHRVDKVLMKEEVRE